MSSRIADHLRRNVYGLIAIFIALGGTAYALDRNTVKSKHIVNGQVKKPDLAADAVTGPKVKDGSLSPNDFDGSSLPSGPPSGPAGGALTGNYPNPQIVPDSINSAVIKNGTIQTVDIADDAITTTEVAPNTLNANDIGHDAVGYSELAPSAFFSGDIGQGTLLEPGYNIKTDAIQSAEVQDATLTGYDIKNDSIAQSDLDADSVGARQLRGISEVTVSATDRDPSFAQAFAHAKCPAGTTILSGGFSVRTLDALSIVSSWRRDNGWFVEAAEDGDDFGDEEVKATSIAYCLRN